MAKSGPSTSKQTPLSRNKSAEFSRLENVDNDSLTRSSVFSNLENLGGAESLTRSDGFNNLENLDHDDLPGPNGTFRNLKNMNGEPALAKQRVKVNAVDRNCFSLYHRQH